MVARLSLGVLILVVLSIVSGIPAASAQDDAENTRFIVQQWLVQELKKPGLILVEYNYSGTSWPDSSLGCPVAGQTYETGEIHGYRWTFLFDNFVRYEVHSDLDGNPAVLCTSTNVAPDVRLAVYTSPTFSILTPESWLVFQDQAGSAVLFAPRAQDQCDDPGMLVTAIGRVASGVTPDQILTDYVAAVGVDEAPTARIPMGSFGRSTAYETPCGSSARKWRVSAFMQYGSAYRVDQWASAERFDQWDSLFQQMLSQFSPAGTSPAGEAVPVPAGTSEAEAVSNGDAASAPSTERKPLPMAHLFLSDLFVTTLDDMPGRSATFVPTIERRYVSFSPDGLFISFVDVDTGQLRVMDAAKGLSPRKVADGVDPTFAPTWSPDSQRIAYAVRTDQTADDGAPIIEVYAVPAVGGAAERLIAFPFGGDCPLSGSDPADSAYMQDVGPNGLDHVLVWLKDERFLVSLRCDGGLGVLSLADQQLISLGDDFLGGALSPDYTRFVARTDSGLALLDFVAWERTNLNVGAAARQLAWSADGNIIYYSTETLADTRTLDDPADEARGEALFGEWPVTINMHDLALFQLDVNTDEETVVWQGQGRGIGRIAPAPDGSGLLFTVVPSSVLLAEVFQAEGDSLALHEAWPEPVLYWLPTSGTTAYLLAYSGQPAFAPITPP